MENQEFDIELLEKKLEEYEQADSNVRSEEVLEFVKKVLDITLLQLSKGNVSDRDIEEDIRFVRDEIGKPDFLKQLVLHVQQAADRWASASKEENGQDYLVSFNKVGKECRLYVGLFMLQRRKIRGFIRFYDGRKSSVGWVL